MQAGKLRHRVLLQSLQTSLDTDGALVEEWTDVFPDSIAAQISPLSGRELIAAAAVQSKISTRIVIRARPGIVASMRAVHRSTVYNIRAVVPDAESGNQWLTLQCESGADEG